MAKLYRITSLVCFFVLAFNGRKLSAQVNAAFSASSTQGCMPLTIQFRDNSTGSPTQWYWDFGNTASSTEQNPLITFYTNGVYTVRLIVRNASSQDYEEKLNYIHVFGTPVTSFLETADSGCAPLQVRFTNTTSLSNASSWAWNFGDGSTSSEQNPSHIFQRRGTFNVSLTATTAEGCTATASKAIVTGNRPIAKFSGSPLDGCASVARSFSNTSSGILTFSYWAFGDGGSSREQNPEYHYQDTGWFPVKLIVGDNGCLDSVLRPRYVHVIAPVTKILMSVYCHDRYTVRFTDKSIGGTDKRQWNFGDGSFSTETDVVHTYARPGTYLIKLKKDADTCSSTATATLIISEKKPILEIQPAKNVFCRGDSIQFFIANYEPALARTFAWDLADTVTNPYWSRATSMVASYSQNGTYKPVVYFKDIYSCIDTINMPTPIQVTGPTAHFTAHPSTGCLDLPINFKDESSVGTGASIKNETWNYGDGFADKITGGPATHVYTFPVLYHVSLAVTDTYNCTDTAYKSLRILKPPVIHARPDTFLCAGQPVTLTATGGVKYTWSSASALICNDCVDPVINPFTSIKYKVIGYDSAGCAANDSVIVTVQQKQEVTMSPSSLTVCAGDSARLTATGADFYSWSPYNNANASVVSPVVYPSTNTTYTVIGSDRYGCFSDTASLNVLVNPKPSVNIANSIVQAYSGSNLILYAAVSDDVQHWEWLPQRDLSCYNCAQPTATVKDNVSYTVTVSNAHGCSNKDAVTIVALCTKEILYIPNTFSPNRDGMNDYFFPRSNNNVSIKSLKIFNRWGQAVFEKLNFSANNAASGWDGRFNNKDQQSDVYVYIMEVKCSNGNTVVRKGDVSLLR